MCSAHLSADFTVSLFHPSTHPLPCLNIQDDHVVNPVGQCDWLLALNRKCLCLRRPLSDASVTEDYQHRQELISSEVKDKPISGQRCPKVSVPQRYF